MLSVLAQRVNAFSDPRSNDSELQASRALLQMARSLSSDGLESSRKSDSSKELGQSRDEPSSGHNTNAKKPDDDDHDILEMAEKTGRLPCAVFHRNVCTPCEKDLTSKRYFVGNSITALSASKLVRSYGPKGGAGSRNDEAIFIRPPNAQAESLHRADLYTHGEWYMRYSEDMYRIERQWQTNGRMNTTETQTPAGKKRKTQTGTEAKEVQQAPSAKETIATTKDGPQSIPAEKPAPANEKVAPYSLPDEAFPVGFQELKVEAQIEWIRAKDNAAKYMTEAWKAYVSRLG